MDTVSSELPGEVNSNEALNATVHGIVLVRIREHILAVSRVKALDVREVEEFEALLLRYLVGVVAVQNSHVQRALEGMREAVVDGVSKDLLFLKSLIEDRSIILVEEIQYLLLQVLRGDCSDGSAKRLVDSKYIIVGWLRIEPGSGQLATHLNLRRHVECEDPSGMPLVVDRYLLDDANHIGEGRC